MAQVAQDNLPGMAGEAGFNRFEQAAIDRLRTHLNTGVPLLTIDEDDLLIDSETLYFAEMGRLATPRNALELVRSGELTDDDIAAKQRAGRNIERNRKADIYADRVITATYAADTTRALYRYLTGSGLIQIEEDDTSETLHNRVADYVADLLRAGRETRVLKGAAMLRITDKIKERFEHDSGAQLVLTELAGYNTMAKARMWLDQLARISRGYSNMTPETRKKLLEYAATRNPEFQNKFNLLDEIAGRAPK